MAALLQQRDLLADIFEAREDAAQLDAVFLATAVTISVETMVVTATGFSGIVPFAMRLRQMKSSRMTPISLPEMSR